MNTTAKLKVMEKLGVAGKVPVDELDEVPDRILDVRYHNHNGDLLLLGFYDLPVGNFCHFDDPDMFLGCDVNVRCYGSDLTYYYEEYMWVHIDKVEDNHLTGRLIDKPFSKLFYYEKGDFLEKGDLLRVPVDEIVDVYFMNADIPEEQKQKLADVYKDIHWETKPDWM